MAITAIFGLAGCAARRRRAPAGPPGPRARRARVGGCRRARAARGRHRARRVHRQRRAVAHLRRAPRREVDGSQEMAGIGLANIAGGLLGGFPVSASSSRTPVAEQAGSRTQLTGVVGAALMIAFILLAPGSHRVPPLRDARRHRHQRGDQPHRRARLASALCAWTRSTRRSHSPPSSACVVFGVLQGIVVTIALSLLAFVIRRGGPTGRSSAGSRGLRGYHDLSRYPEGARLPGIVIVRFDAPLFFANGAIFDDYVRSRVEAAGPGVTHRDPRRPSRSPTSTRPRSTS